MNDSSLQKSVGHILIVDDDKDNCFLLRNLLEKEGYRVSEAYNGTGCLEIFQQETPDIVLLDIVMPGMDGFETCARLQELSGGEQTPVLLLSFLSDDTSIKRVFEAGAADYVNKPINWSILRQRVKQLIMARRAEQLRNDLFYMIIHDMKNPVASINGYAETLVEETCFDTESKVHKIGQLILEQGRELLEKTLLILDIGRLEENRLALNTSEVSLAEVIETLTLNLSPRLTKRKIVFNTELSARLVIKMDCQLIYRAIENLALLLSEHLDPTSHLTLSGNFDTDRKQAYLRLEYTPKQILNLPNLLDKISPVALQYHFVLNFCRLVIEMHGGYLTHFSNSKTRLSRFTFWFPNKIVTNRNQGR